MSLPPQTQRAILCYKIIQYIKDLEFPARDNIDPRTSQEPQIISIREELLRNRLVQENIVGKECYDETMKIFKLNEGLPLDRLLKKHQSILFASDENKQNHTTLKTLVFFPTHVTTNIFKAVIEADRKQAIFGIGGIGKTISTVLLCHLSNQIIQMRINEDLERVNDFVDMEKFMKIPKIFHIILEEDTTILDYINQIRLQAPEAHYFQQKCQKFNQAYELEAKSKRQEIALQFFGQILRNLQELYQSLGIDTTFIIDEAQDYYRMTNRLMVAYKDNKKNLAQKLTEKISTISSMLKLLKRCFPRMSLITSERIVQDSLQRLAEQKQWEQDSVFRLDIPMKAVRCDLEADFRLDSQYFQMQMYLTLWFELLRKFRKEGDVFSPEQQHKLFKNYMKSTEFFFTDDDYANCEVWTREKTHLIMRESVQKLSLDNVREVFNQYFPLYKRKPERKSSQDEYSDEQDEDSKRKRRNKKEPIPRWQLQFNAFRDIISFIQDEAKDIQTFYKKYLDEEKNVFLKMSKFGLLTSMAGNQYQQIKYKHKHHFCNRFLMVDKPKPKQKAFDEIALEELIKCGKISIQNDQMIVNHSILGFAYGCKFVSEDFGFYICNPALFLADRSEVTMENAVKHLMSPKK